MLTEKGQPRRQVTSGEAIPLSAHGLPTAPCFDFRQNSIYHLFMNSKKNAPWQIPRGVFLRFSHPVSRAYAAGGAWAVADKFAPV